MLKRVFKIRHLEEEIHMEKRNKDSLQKDVLTLILYTLLDDAQILNYDDKMNIIYFVWNGVNHCSLKREIKIFIYSTQFTPNYYFKSNNIGMYTFGCMLSIYGIYTCVYAIASHPCTCVCDSGL